MIVVSAAASEMLRQEATSGMSGWLTLILVGWVAGVVVVRAVVLVDPRPVDYAANLWVAGSLVVVGLRDATVQQLLGSSVGLSLADIRSITHLMVLYCAASLAILGFYWERGRLPYPHLPRVLLIVATVIGVVLWFIALPARRAGIAVEELASWRTGLYMTLYALPTLLAEIPALITAVLMLRERSARSRTFFGCVVLFAIAGSSFDHLTRMLSGWFLAFGEHNALTDARTHSNDVLFLPILAVLVVIALPGMISSIRIRLGRDRHSEGVKLLAPIWSAVTNELPEVRLTETHGLVSAAEKAHRMRIEIEDAVVELACWLPPGTNWPADARGQAAVLSEALRRYSTGVEQRHPVRPPEWLKTEGGVDAVACAWQQQMAETRDPVHTPTANDDVWEAQ